MSKKYLLPVIAVFVIAGFGFAGSVWSDDAQPAAPQVKRNILDRHDQSGVDGKEIVIGTADFPPGSTIGWHVHPGDEAGIVLKGSLILHVRGQPDREVKAGDHFFNPRGTVHSVTTVPGTDGGMAFSTWIVDKGKPMAEPVK
jgi:quercetin dioxygenase-like cupin family protein